MDNPNTYPFSDLEANVMTLAVVPDVNEVTCRQQVDTFPRGAAARADAPPRRRRRKRVAGERGVEFGVFLPLDS